MPGVRRGRVEPQVDVKENGERDSPEEVVSLRVKSAGEQNALEITKAYRFPMMSSLSWDSRPSIIWPTMISYLMV